MEPKAFRAMVKRAETATPEAIHAAVQAYADRPPSLHMLGDVAVIPMCGPITYKRSWFSMFFGGATIEDMQTQFRLALRDDSVKSIAFRCDTPGGTVDYVPEFADEIFAARGQKPIIALADTMICSAGIWLASQADAIYVSSSSSVGSIGVFLEHVSFAKMLEQAGVKVTLISYGENKTAGNEYEDLTPEAEADFQALVNDVGAEFDGAMARGRGVSRKVVADAFGQGKVFRGKKIIAAGLADKMGTFTQVMGKLTKGRGMVAAGGVDIHATIEPVTVPEARKTGMGSRQDEDCCHSCSEACPCEHTSTCPADCPTCEAGCQCATAAEDAKATADAEARVAADNDALAVMAVLANG
jgi:signal peptide peptidase SppA